MREPNVFVKVAGGILSKKALSSAQATAVIIKM